MYCKQILIVFLLLGVSSCIPSNTYEKNESILHHRWKKEKVKSFDIKISDTTSQYLLFLTLRHTDAYHYSNIWINLETIKPDGKSSKQRVELPLAESSGRWTGKGMNEIYEHKIRLSGNAYTKFTQKGTYKIKLQHVMRENPLEEILSVGVRLEKVPSSQ
jgi:gliding motility-associated lipoprotein GldH